MSLTPAQDTIEAQRKKDNVEKCGRNMGPHDYIPIAWTQTDNTRAVTRLFCRVCFKNIAMKTLIENYPEIKL